jgi:hypothetical protein
MAGDPVYWLLPTKVSRGRSSFTFYPGELGQPSIIRCLFSALGEFTGAMYLGQKFATSVVYKLFTSYKSPILAFR